jgi:hypothetical protein
MPRGAIPSPRSEIVAAEAYRPDPEAAARVPSGAGPSPNYELAAAQPFRVSRDAPESHLSWPLRLADWGGADLASSTWAEEAFAKACAEPSVLVPPDVVTRAKHDCGDSNFAQFMQTRGFETPGVQYLDGAFRSVRWTDAAVLNGAISEVGPVKIGAALASLAPRPHGWCAYNLPAGQPQDGWASLCGYGSRAVLADLFARHHVTVAAPAGMPQGLCYAVYALASIGIIDRQSLINITGEAWVRMPTTIVRPFGA